MKRLLTFLLTLMIMVLVVISCNEQDTITPGEETKEYGYLSLQLALQIDQLPAGRIMEVNTDDFIVTIHDATNGIEVLRFDPFSSAPAEIELLTGEYFVRATNLEPPANAEFELPWYFGESDIFNIDKEELKSIDVNCTLANCKVSFVYSENVLADFTDWNATTTLINEGDFLQWPKGDDREGYFITSPLAIDVYLEYTKVYTGELITRNFATTIADPQPATHYRINIDASLEDGKILINITVDEEVEVIDIDLGDGNEGGGSPGNEDWEPGEEWNDERDGQTYETVQIGEQVWMAENLKFETESGSWWYNDDADIGAVYGRMYTWEAAMNGEAPSDAVPSGVQGACPANWHLPSQPEWHVLTAFLNPSAGGKMKQAGTTNWNSPNLGATNESGFNGLPGGWFPQLPGYSASGLGTLGVFHTASTHAVGPYMMILHKDTDGLGGQAPNNNAVSIRCVKD